MSNRKLNALKIASVYIVLGFSCILSADRFLSGAVKDGSTAVLANILKDWIYVFATGIFIFLLIRSTLKKASLIETRLFENNHEMRHIYGKIHELESYNLSAREELKQQNAELMETQKKLERLAFYDSLTGLPNRLALYEDFKEHDGACAAKYAVLSIDIDNFNFINDTMGHSYGDKLIIAVVDRLNAVFHGKCKLYRMGGDAFIIVTDDAKSLDHIMEYAEMVIYKMKSQFRIEQSGIYITISIGVAICPDHGSSIDELLKRSDIAMHRAKESGKSRYVVFSDSMDEVVRERMIVEKNLRTSLENNELFLHYQPQYDLKENRITGFEALLRWNNPELGFVPPDRFIDVAEKTHLIIPIGDWVMRNACLFIREIHRQGRPELGISVNISIIQVLQDDFTEKVLRLLNLIGVNPCRLELEITESVVVESYELIGKKLDLLRKAGVRIALDDFGKGFSSLSGLLNLKIDTIKIDKVFVDNIDPHENRSLAENIIMIGNKMGLVSLAEGVETREQHDYLVKHGCNKIQGFFFSRPLPGEKAKKLVSSTTGGLPEPSCRHGIRRP